MKTRLTIAALALLGAGTAIAAGHMKNADADGDGFVSLDEMKAAHNARIEEHFSQADTNGDGLLSADERKAAGKAKRANMKEKRKHRKRMRRSPERIVEKLDVDGSGSVSLDEFQGRRHAPDAESFSAADANGNGELDAGELEAMMAAQRAERKAKRQERLQD